MTYVDYLQALQKKYPNDKSSKEYLFVSTSIDQELVQLLQDAKGNLRNLASSTSNGISVSTLRYDDAQGIYVIVPFDSSNRMTIYQPLTSEMNIELYQYYQLKGIDIYNPSDRAFVDSCYYNDNFDYDLPQKYRRMSIYQNKTITPTELDCTYIGYDLELNYIKLECPYGGSYSYVFKEQHLTLEKDIDHVDNLPTKCGGSIDSLSKNIAFWFFIVLAVIFIIVDILLLIGFKKGKKEGNIEIAIQNDELTDENQAKFNHVTITDHTKISVEEVSVQIPQTELSFGSIFIHNLSSLHPIFTLCRSSILMPIIFNTWIFIYNIFNLFGFNALYFNETMIEDRITDSQRNNFGYPMKTEFEKIMAAIATSIVLTIIVKAINIVTINQKTELSNKLTNAKSITEKQNISNNFSNSYLIRRIISGIFMLALIVFFFYYCVVFCGIYIKTQYGWFYSGIWSLFFNWIVFAPLYILIISLIENNSGNTPCVYYMKRLFIF